MRLSPGWEGTGRPDDELNFKGVTMDQADLELNPPRDRYNYYLCYIIFNKNCLYMKNLCIISTIYNLLIY